ncbi:diacylglycerol/lipid kinase family protein [Kordiimonas aquimaris]|uniref:diacylglycerol/lipid kinase family protein n=1 Tax=Kordiimonas aquimaris TaxID=707591 RepID=UPI0021D0B45A|nr:diacylglycerol kinase family protein [Kordiimonas aquimaris]
MSQHVLVISNPTAGRANSHYVTDLIAALGNNGFNVKHVETGPGGSIVVDPAEAIDVVLAVGGDGTIRDIINKLSVQNYKLAIAPSGTANVLAAEIGQAAGVRDVVNTIMANNDVSLNLGFMDGAYFSVMASVGFDADVVHTVNLKLKKRFGKLAYFMAAIKAFWHFRPQRFSVTIDGENHACEGVILSNSRYYGGTFTCAKNARITDPLLHACLIRLNGRVDVIKFVLAMVRGRLHVFDGVKFVAGTAFAIPEPGLCVQCDGDDAGKTPLHCVSELSSKVRILLPSN